MADEALNINKPSSGSYGEKSDLQNLKRQLPSSGATAPAGPPTPEVRPSNVTTLPQPEGGRPVQGPPGFPSVLLHPTQRPGVPVSTPLQQAPASSTPAQARLMQLDTLISAPGVSQATREWAMAVRDQLLRGRG